MKKPVGKYNVWNKITNRKGLAAESGRADFDFWSNFGLTVRAYLWRWLVVATHSCTCEYISAPRGNSMQRYLWLDQHVSQMRAGVALFVKIVVTLLKRPSLVCYPVVVLG